MQVQMVNSYSNGQRLAFETARQLRESGDLELCVAWQITARAWYQHRAFEMGIDDAIIPFCLSDASIAHERVNAFRGTPGKVRLAVPDVPR